MSGSSPPPSYKNSLYPEPVEDVNDDSFLSKIVEVRKKELRELREQLTKEKEELCEQLTKEKEELRDKLVKESEELRGKLVKESEELRDKLISESEELKQSYEKSIVLSEEHASFTLPIIITEKTRLEQLSVEAYARARACQENHMVCAEKYKNACDDFEDVNKKFLDMEKEIMDKHMFCREKTEIIGKEFNDLNSQLTESKIILEEKRKLSHINWNCKKEFLDYEIYVEELNKKIFLNREEQNKILLIFREYGITDIETFKKTRNNFLKTPLEVYKKTYESLLANLTFPYCVENYFMLSYTLSSGSSSLNIIHSKYEEKINLVKTKIENQKKEILKKEDKKILKEDAKIFAKNIWNKYYCDGHTRTMSTLDIYNKILEDIENIFNIFQNNLFSKARIIFDTIDAERNMIYAKDDVEKSQQEMIKLGDEIIELSEKMNTIENIVNILSRKQ